MRLAPGDATAARADPRRWLRGAVHALAIVAGWALFFWGWHRVLARGTDFSELQRLMIGAAVVVPVVTVSWILHNQGIHRRKGPRKKVPAATLDYRVDFNGREVVADFPALTAEQCVDIAVAGGHKRYRARDGHDWRVRRPGEDAAARARLAIDQMGQIGQIGQGSAGAAAPGPTAAAPAAATQPAAAAPGGASGANSPADP
jgi:hypothetical protein